MFKRGTGITVSQYITSARISLAKQLLIKTQKSISEIAIDVGFVNFSYFSTTFLKVVWVSPNIFRRVMLQLPTKSYSDFFVTDADGSLIYASDSELFEKYSKYSFNTTVGPVSEFARKHLMSYLYDKEYQCFFVVLSDLDGMYENIIPIRTIFWVVTMFVVIIALLAFMVIVDYFSSPILSGIDTSIKRNGMDAESTFSGFKKILSKNVRLQEWMSENKPLY